MLSPEVSHPGQVHSSTGSAMPWEEGCGKCFLSTFICGSFPCCIALSCAIGESPITFSSSSFILSSSVRCCLLSFLLSLSCFPFDVPSASTLLHHRRPSQNELGLIIRHLDLSLLPPALEKIGG